MDCVTLLQARADEIIRRGAQSIVEPFAVFGYDQPDGDGGSFPIYTVYGGPLDRSSVSAMTLQQRGIPIMRDALGKDAPHLDRTTTRYWEMGDDDIDEFASGMTSAAYMLGAALLCGLLFVVVVVLWVWLT